jgi:outer membrane protein
MQILYANESVKINNATVDVSAYQVTRAQQLLQSGSISKADLAQLESQYSSDKYQLTISENSLKTYKLQLKQLLELTIADEININIPEISQLDVLKPLPSLQSIYEKSLTVMPLLKSSKTNLQIANLETEKAKAGYLPKLSLNANVGTSNASGTGQNITHQIKNNWGNVIGIAVSIPVFSNRENKSAVEKAILSQKTAKLELQDSEKDLLKEIESVYQNAISAQSQYIASLEKEKALRTSYELVEQQYALGMKNTLELLTEKNNLIAAQQGLIQAKYMSIMNAQLLNLYQELPLEIK